jgi:hypothetical protein
MFEIILDILCWIYLILPMCYCYWPKYLSSLKHKISIENYCDCKLHENLSTADESYWHQSLLTWLASGSGLVTNKTLILINTHLEQVTGGGGGKLSTPPPCSRMCTLLLKLHWYNNVWSQTSNLARLFILFWFWKILTV